MLGITKKVRKGENVLLLSVGATGSGKSETFFKNIGVKRDKDERIDEALVLQMFERLIDQEVQENKDSSIVNFECQYLQIFNENLFDLLKKVSINRFSFDADYIRKMKRKKLKKQN